MSTISEKRSFFLRTSSIQKIKCSATYPFRLAGTRISKDVGKELFESLIVKARIFSQRILVTLYLAAYEMLGVLVSIVFNIPTIGLIQDEVCDKKKNFGVITNFQHRLYIKLKQHKENVLSKYINVAQQQQQQQQNLKCLDKKTENIITKFEKVLNTNNFKEKHQSQCLVVLIYGVAAFIYFQLLILTLALNTVELPPGLWFMIVSLTLIAFLAVKIFVAHNTKKLKDFKKTSELKTNEEKLYRRSSRSRERTPTIQELNNKPLSKIKLL